MRLIEVDRRGDIVGNDLVVLPGLGDAVHLHRQEHRDSRAIQFARQQYHGGSSPTVAEENDVGL